METNRTTDVASTRVAVLEHALRKMSERFWWLAKYHAQTDYAKEVCKALANECWEIQARTKPAKKGKTS